MTLAQKKEIMKRIRINILEAKALTQSYLSERTITEK